MIKDSDDSLKLSYLESRFSNFFDKQQTFELNPLYCNLLANVSMNLYK